MSVQAVKQVFGRRLFGSADRFGFCLWRGRVGSKTLSNERIVLGLVVGQAVRGQGGVSLGGRRDFVFDVAQQALHLCGPCLVVLFDDKGEVAQVMDVAEAMLTVAKLEVRAPVIMQSNALVMGQDASGSHADMPAFVMDVVLGQFCCAGHVQPPQPPCDTHAALIEMDDRRSNQLLTNLFQTRLRTAGKLAGGREDDRLRRRIPVERSQQLP